MDCKYLTYKIEHPQACDVWSYMKKETKVVKFGKTSMKDQ